MRLSAPKRIVFQIAVILAVIALLSILVPFTVPVVGTAWLALIAFALLFLGNVLRGF